GAAPPALADGAEAARPAAQPADLVGKQLGDFKILRRLGAGGMAEVFLAEQVSLKRQVALKVLKPELLDGSDDTHLRRFVQEATAAANLNHPHIVQVYAIGEQRGIHYIAQEYVPGLTLREWLRRNGPPEPLAAIRILRQVALALQAAAEAGIVHRDVKPENILLTKKGDAKVADFGLAQLSQTGERVQLTQTGITMGTPLYMSPEQVAGKPLDHRSDLYSLGVTAYHLLAGSPPFRGETALSVAVQHLNAPAEPLQDVRPDLPVALAELVQKMMEKRPERRYQSAADLAEDLRALGVALKTDPQGAVKKGLDSFTTAKPAAPARRPLALDRFFEWPGGRHAATLAAAAAVVLLLSVAVGRATKPADPFRLPPPTDSDVPKADDARDQYNAALVAGTAEAYQAVREYWKDDPGASFWRALATLRLALLRLSERDFTGAAELFREMTASPDEWSRVNGAAGLAILAALQDQEPEFRRILSQLLLTDDVDELHSELRYLLEGIRERDRFNRETQLDLDRLLDEAGAEQPDGRGGQAGSPGPPAS
ncbi:MAG TPA: serine/threonine-protein kinase, partial [Planctomycetaceae bacterium]